MCSRFLVFVFPGLDGLGCTDCSTAFFPTSREQNFFNEKQSCRVLLFFGWARNVNRFSSPATTRPALARPQLSPNKSRDVLHFRNLILQLSPAGKCTHPSTSINVHLSFSHHSFRTLAIQFGADSTHFSRSGAWRGLQVKIKRVFRFSRFSSLEGF